MSNIKVLIVDDHTLLREGIRAFLELNKDIEIVGEASNGKEALEKVKELRPDVVLMDLAMPIMGGLEATRRIRKHFPDTSVVALTQYDDSEYVLPIIEAGACGYVTKTAASSELSFAIQAACKGESFLSPSAAVALVKDYRQKSTSNGEKDRYQQLTTREREVLKLIAEGYSTREIANMLNLNHKTIGAFRRNLMKKLNINNNTDLIKFAIRKRVITL